MSRPSALETELQIPYTLHNRKAFRSYILVAKMHFSGILFAALSVLVPFITAETVSWHPDFSNAGFSLNGVACSDGANGLQRKGYRTLGDLPTFPMIGSVSRVAGWNSPNCGTCWKLTHEGRTVTILAVDHCASGFDLSLEAMNALTGGRGVELGRIDAQAVQVPATECHK
ncbi:cerato-platanin domain-containing protein [Purpureocillium lavendulum]|uniref:Cerato-platanin domain-containing protein n=1 Tax=Purpureocillium lavendulum TaxID=1247861 RepID=A0AB34FPA7_9HYPO|nr:cerato-platanin domain-containing protein [Purpureocillium lavendulum]